MKKQPTKDFKPAALNPEAATAFELAVALSANTLCRCGRTGTKFTPETVTLAQVKAMVEAGSDLFRAKKVTAPATTEGKK